MVLKVVLEDVESYLSANLLLITKRVGSDTEFFEYEVVSHFEISLYLSFDVLTKRRWL